MRCCYKSGIFLWQDNPWEVYCNYHFCRLKQWCDTYLLAFYLKDFSLGN
jgi:hypothetical protein